MNIEVSMAFTANDALMLHRNTDLFNKEICAMMNYYGSKVSVDYLDECSTRDLFNEMWLCGMSRESSYELDTVDSRALRRAVEMLEDHDVPAVPMYGFITCLVKSMVDAGVWRTFIYSN